MVKLKITEKGKINKEHGHEWDELVGKISSILSKDENAFFNITNNHKTIVCEEADK